MHAKSERQSQKSNCNLVLSVVLRWTIFHYRRTHMPIGPRPSRKLHKHRLNLRLSEESADFLRRYSAKSHCTISELAELIIREYRATEENYFTKSAAYFGFVNTSLSLMIASKLFEPELAPTGPLTGIKEDITRAAEKLFGPQPTSPFRWYCTDGDERLWSLYHAFAAHHLKRGDHVGSLDVR